ncbi:MAG: hypothetical protein ACYSWZ_21300, partial [Planctomycetota bacterium]
VTYPLSIECFICIYFCLTKESKWTANCNQNHHWRQKKKSKNHKAGWNVESPAAEQICIDI